LPISIEELLDQARQTAAKISVPLARSQAYLEIVEAYLAAGRQSLGRELLADALKAVESLRHPDRKAGCLAWLGRLWAAAGDMSQAAALFQRAVLLSRAAETPSQKMEALYRIAEEYAGAGLKAEAGGILSELHAAVTHPEPGIDTAAELINISRLYADLDNTDEVRTALAEALQTIESHQDLWFKAERFTEIADLYAACGFRAEAAGALEKALALVRTLDREGQPYFLLKIVSVYREMGENKQAVEILSGIPEMVFQEEPSPSRSATLVEVAGLYIDLGDGPAAVKLLAWAQQLLINTGEVRDTIASLIRIAEAWEEMGQAEKALELADRALILSDDVEDARSRIYLLGQVACLLARLKNQDRAREAVSRVLRVAGGGNVKTTGLGSIAADLAAAQEYDLALKLVEVIREPEARVSALTSFATFSST
jgi:tetratricopeptide (TPR) repeat protein